MAQQKRSDERSSNDPGRSSQPDENTQRDRDDDGDMERDQESIAPEKQSDGDMDEEGMDDDAYLDETDAESPKPDRDNN